RRASLRIAPVWIDMFDQAQVDQRIALNGDRANQFLGRDGDARRRLRANRYRPKQYQKHDACREDEPPLERTHKHSWAGNYTRFVKKCSTATIELRAHLSVSRNWTCPVERCMFSAVQIQTDALSHFVPVRCIQYIVRSATRGRPNFQCSSGCGGGREGRRSPTEQCFCQSLRNRGAERCHYRDFQEE